MTSDLISATEPSADSSDAMYELTEEEINLASGGIRSLCGKVMAPDSEPARVARARSFQFVVMSMSFRWE